MQTFRERESLFTAFTFGDSALVSCFTCENHFHWIVVDDHAGDVKESVTAELSVIVLEILKVH